MNRRKFLGAMGATGASVFIPSSLNLTSIYKSANAAVNYSVLENSSKPGPDVTGASVPSTMPQVINIFLYGGPSELAGNLTNIADIENNSVNSYAGAFGPEILAPDNDGTGANGQITKDGFWFDAGGNDLQFMLDEGYMSIYRTITKVLDPTRSHRESLLMSQKGSLDIEAGAGIGTRLAIMLIQNRGAYEGNMALADGPVGTIINNIETDLLLPFVSFEGDTRLFATDPDLGGNAIPLNYRGITLDQNFDNPFARGSDTNATELRDLVEKVKAATPNLDRYSKVIDGFELREFLESKIQGLNDAKNATLPIITEDPDILAMGGVAGVSQVLTYPNTGFANRLKAAITLAVENPSTLFTAVSGSSGLGGWDDHNNATTDYRGRMTDLFDAMKSAMLHIKYSGSQTAGVTSTPGTVVGNPQGLPVMLRPTNNIIINIHGDFGRLVNLNDSNGWDHANNQNLYTFGGQGLVGAAGEPLFDANGDQIGAQAATRSLGKVVGVTELRGTTKTNNQFTLPVAGSYEAEPMSIASSVYSYFGAQNPNALTADDLLNTDGVPALNEVAADEKLP